MQCEQERLVEKFYLKIIKEVIKSLQMSFNVFLQMRMQTLIKTFIFLLFIVYFYLFTYFSFIFIDCHRFNFRLKRFTSGIDLFIFSFPRVEMPQDL